MLNGTLGKVEFYNQEPIILGKSACYINFYDRVEKRYNKYLPNSGILDNLDNEIKIHIEKQSEKLANFVALKNSILDKAFSGELTA